MGEARMATHAETWWAASFGVSPEFDVGKVKKEKVMFKSRKGTERTQVSQTIGQLSKEERSQQGSISATEVLGSLIHWMTKLYSVTVPDLQEEQACKAGARSQDISLSVASLKWEHGQLSCWLSSSTLKSCCIRRHWLPP